MVYDISNAARSAAADARLGLLDAGSTNATGQIWIYDAGESQVLAKLALSNPAFGAAVNGVATAGAISSTTGETGISTADAVIAHFVDRDEAVVFKGTVGTAGADVVIDTQSIAEGQSVSCSGATWTEPAS